MKIFRKSNTILLFTVIFAFIAFAGANGKENSNIKSSLTTNDTIILSSKHKPNFIVCDLDGDKKKDSVFIVENTVNKKFGLKIVYANKKIDYLGMGKKVLTTEFDDFEWVGVFEKAPKGKVYFENVDESGDIITDNKILDKNKIKLKNDGIYVHAYESCGGGVIYLKNDKYVWIQQE